MSEAPNVDLTLDGIKKLVERQVRRNKDGVIVYKLDIITLARSQVEALIAMAEKSAQS